MKTILNRLRKLENGHLAPVETEAGRRARQANERLNQRLVAASARLRALGCDEFPAPQVAELTESERADFTGSTLGQRIRYHVQRQREWTAEIDGHNTAPGALQR